MTQRRTASLAVPLTTLIVAAALWWVVFRWQPINFWALMALATGLLGALALLVRGPSFWREGAPPGDLALAVAVALALYGVFWVGNRVVAHLPFAPQQVGSIYALKGEARPWAIALALLLVIGPGEELYWRGLLQHALEGRYGPWRGWALGTVAYGGVHVLSANPMVVVAATVAGGVWGALYLWRRRILPVILCHALWDLLVLLLLPLR